MRFCSGVILVFLIAEISFVNPVLEFRVFLRRHLRIAGHFVLRVEIFKLIHVDSIGQPVKKTTKIFIYISLIMRQLRGGRGELRKSLIFKHLYMVSEQEKCQPFSRWLARFVLFSLQPIALATAGDASLVKVDLTLLCAYGDNSVSPAKLTLKTRSARKAM